MRVGVPARLRCGDNRAGQPPSATGVHLGGMEVELATGRSLRVFERAKVLLLEATESWARLARDVAQGQRSASPARRAPR